MSAGGHRYLVPQARYNHVATLAFTVENNDPDGKVTSDELIHGLMRRITMLLEEPNGFANACEVYDTVDNEEDT